jgi:hypothetical protein
MRQFLSTAGWVVPSALANMRDAGRVLFATLREIFDETAYDRFLIRRGINSSPQAYAAFRREQECAKARRPRCC